MEPSVPLEPTQPLDNSKAVKSSLAYCRKNKVMMRLALFFFFFLVGMVSSVVPRNMRVQLLSVLNRPKGAVVRHWSHLLHQQHQINGCGGCNSHLLQNEPETAADLFQRSR